MSSTTINCLPAQVLSHIFGLLSRKECAVVCCVQRSWNFIASDDSMWKTYCADDWLMDRPVLPTGQSCHYYRAAYVAWYKVLGDHSALYRRAKRCVNALESWMKANIPRMATVLDGVSEDVISKAEATVGPFPPVVRILYMLFNGQRLPPAEFLGEPGNETLFPYPLLYNGLLGGYEFYDHDVNVRWLPLQHALTCAEGLHLTPSRRYLIFAASYRWLKFFAVDLDDGMVYTGCHRGRVEHATMMACLQKDTPPSPDSAAAAAESTARVDARNDACELRMRREGENGARVQQTSRSSLRLAANANSATPSGSWGEGASIGGPKVLQESTSQEAEKDGLLRWLEEYVRRLQSGMYAVRREPNSPCKSIGLFPQTGPNYSVEVTNGVQVRCSSVFVPELSSMGGHPNYWFAYSVCMRLLPHDGRQGSARRFKSCQLRARHWIMQDETEALPQEVRGDAVIGQYPVLHEGGEEFVYQSCTNLRGRRGWMEGDFTMVPGSLWHPAGDEFEAKVGRLLLEVPSFIY
ncbi:hypothetical protein CBR_g726 [Chara braunii]|uniref:ApaG domain-containing protein n=1 Tax=Chara braunii TaxID=69332 RepID=A0A388KC56_CHABU|nr:hypothetical protein CBR_g726 [Chara braunii]|eukprot:GBG67597.1 hypothetical protein CBR_g726 [Chara braunii]